MIRTVPRFFTLLAIPALLFGHATPRPLHASIEQPDVRTLPWAGAGLDARQAAAHLLDRFSFGPQPGDIDRVVSMGLEAWFAEQLAGAHPDTALDKRLAPLKSLDLTLHQTVERYPRPSSLLRAMRREGTLPEGMEAQIAEGDRDELRRVAAGMLREQGLRPQRELLGEMLAQKLLRARYSENQLHEVLVDFWFNHFNVSTTDNEARPYVGLYERDAIRPHVTGRFRDMLGATARHPAMLLYLDNARSVAEEGVETALDRTRRRAGLGRSGARAARFEPGRGSDRSPGADSERARRRPSGLNENYARELLELHTLGVDGGYDQQDVREVARAFTGWTAEPPRRLMDEAGSRRLERARRLPASSGFVFESGFVFRPDVHDAERKRVLGTRLPAGRGIEDGEAVLDLLADHPSTARHIARKLAIRFVADAPPEPLVATLASTFAATRGDLAATLWTLVEHEAFWAEAARHQKIKSPFELAVSALRALDVRVHRPRGAIEWVERMGQPLYAYQAPTGFPDRAASWVNTGALLARMNFGLALASGQVAGTRVDLAALVGGREPPSTEEALATYAALLLPERDPSETVRRLAPSLTDPDLAGKLAAELPPPASHDGSPDASPDASPSPEPGSRSSSRSLDQVVGLILGSPAFQRR